LLAGQIAHWTNNNWRAIMGLPSLVLLALLVISWRIIPNDRGPVLGDAEKASGGFNFAYVGTLLKLPQLWIVCAVAFSLYIMRETFNDWTVDFFKTQGGDKMSLQAAAMLSTPFDAAGAVGIVLMGWGFDALSRRGRTIVLVSSLTALALLINYLPAFYKMGMWQVETAIALIGLLSYGPYSLLAGVFAVEIGGKKGVSTVAGMVDSAGYMGTIFAGQEFGRLVDKGGYPLGFHVLALVTFAAAIFCLMLKPRQSLAE
jgi:OPA family glycerol-3-phosphate transporter-like MFS transporter